jgi:hypothetical protein
MEARYQVMGSLPLRLRPSLARTWEAVMKSGGLDNYQGRVKAGGHSFSNLLSLRCKTACFVANTRLILPSAGAKSCRYHSFLR